MDLLQSQIQCFGYARVNIHVFEMLMDVSPVFLLVHDVQVVADGEVTTEEVHFLSYSHYVHQDEVRCVGLREGCWVINGLIDGRVLFKA